ncbi:MAG: HEPN domain-containing protein [Candidatus Omnitrophica bacterium]|nr:HEPN domain-containing protein [Candidatus Omnitrophota bacterium]
MKEITKEWIKKAEEDYRVAIREFKAKPLACYAVCFHSQQCIEKYMKAILQENNVSFEKIHDLEILLSDCKKFTPSLENYREELIWLTTFAVEVRYPGFEINKIDAEKAINFMRKIRRILRGYFKEK